MALLKVFVLGKLKQMNVGVNDNLTRGIRMAHEIKKN